LLVETRAGYQNLCRLITRMKLRARKGEGAVTEEELAEHASGLICLTGGEEGTLGVGVRSSGIGVREKRETESRVPRRCAERLCEIFGRRSVYVELQRHFDRKEEARNQAAVEMARGLGLPLVATNGVCYAARRQREILDV